MKKSVLIAPLLVMATATAAAADRVDRVKVYDHTKTIVTNVPVTKTSCEWVDVPIYQDTVVQGGNAGEGALMGMIVGGLLGKGVTGKDDGAAAGAVIGGIIGADKATKPKTKRVIVDYKSEKRCDEVTVYQEQYKEVYSHSTIRFYLNGQRYVLEFQK